MWRLPFEVTCLTVTGLPLRCPSFVLVPVSGVFSLLFVIAELPFASGMVLATVEDAPLPHELPNHSAACLGSHNFGTYAVQGQNFKIDI